MKFEPLDIVGAMLLTPEVHYDHRGFFLETFRLSDFRQRCGDYHFVQDNFSHSKGNTLRGLHYQINAPQGKLVQVLHGEILDVIVDLRKSSETFGEFSAVRLSSDARTQLWVPPGLAHGFYVISDSADVFYKCTSYFEPQWSRTLAWNTQELSIDWPLEHSTSPILSEKDANGVPLSEAEVFD